MLELAKKNIAEEALKFVKDNSILALGTGSTVDFFIDALQQKIEKGLTVKCIASSEKTFQKAKELKISMLDVNKTEKIDILVDGADLIDSEKRMIKGGGGALLREKILYEVAEEKIIIVDETKLSKSFEMVKLPLEIIPFAANLTKKKLENLGYIASFRKDLNEDFFVTDNNNYILDLEIKKCNPEKLNKDLIGVTGVVETGFFLKKDAKIIIGFKDKRVEIWD